MYEPPGHGASTSAPSASSSVMVTELGREGSGAGVRSGQQVVETVAVAPCAGIAPCEVHDAQASLGKPWANLGRPTLLPSVRIPRVLLQVYTV